MDDAEAFCDFYRREGEPVLLFLTRRTWDGEVALDLTAETFAVVLGSWRRVGALAPEQQRAWLFTVARRQLSHYLRRAKVEQRALRRLGMQVPQIEHGDLLEIEERAGLRALRPTLERELGRLSPPHREALRLRVVDELGYEEIARMLDISEQTARARVSRALRTLSRALEAPSTSQASSLRRSANASEGAQ